MNDAGKISFLPRGEYDSGTMYEALDVVKYDGMVWAAKKSSKGITPAEGENWMCLLTAADYATADEPGIVKPDGDTITVDGSGTIKINIDSELSDTSENPVKNSIVTDAFNTVFKQLNGITFGVSQNNCLTVTYDDGN